MPGSDRWIGDNRDHWYGETPRQHHEALDDYHGSHGALRSTRNEKTVIFDRGNPPVRRTASQVGGSSYSWRFHVG